MPHMSRSARWVWAVMALGVCVAVTAGASTLLPADFRVTVTDATVIVRGRVTDVRAVRSLSGEVETVATVAVEATLKGDARTFVSMRLPGGVIGRYRTVMPGAPRVEVGEAGVFFLKAAPGGSLWPVGLSSGIYRVSSGDGRPMVTPPVLPGVTTAATGVVRRGDTRRTRLPLSEFESLVALVLNGTRGGAR
jgi:hypothetical protein